MRFLAYDSLRLFTVVARHLSYTAAAVELNLSKGAVSYRIARLEHGLGFKLFHRQNRRISLTAKGKRLLSNARTAFEELETEIETLRRDGRSVVTIGMSTYFASRWLSPRLMTFTSRFPAVGLRLQPTVGPVDLRTQDIDMVIRWGNGKWTDLEIERLFDCPAFPTAGAAMARAVEKSGLTSALEKATLLHDYEGSNAWRNWFHVAGMPYPSQREDLVIPDPNVRVQAVIDGQGVALNDALVNPELEAGRLFRISEVRLTDYGYFLAFPRQALDNPALKQFLDWITQEARGEKDTSS